MPRYKVSSCSSRPFTIVFLIIPLPSLAYAELYLGLVAVLRRFDNRFELYETDLGDIEYQWDHFVPGRKAGTQGVRVLVKGR